MIAVSLFWVSLAFFPTLLPFECGSGCGMGAGLDFFFLFIPGWIALLAAGFLPVGISIVLLAAGSITTGPLWGVGLVLAGLFYGQKAQTRSTGMYASIVCMATGVAVMALSIFVL